MRIKFSLGLIYLCFISCNNIENKKEKLINTDVSESVVEIPKKNEFTFLENVPERNLPLKDSTNFDNFHSNNFLNSKQLEQIQFNKIAESYENVVAHYQLNLSPKFKTFVFTYNRGEMELFSTLVNFDNNFKFIAKQDISYDEIAESWLKTESEISKNEIIVNELSYTEEVEKSQKTTYKILQNGEFKIIK